MPRVGESWNICGMSFLGKRQYIVLTLILAIVRFMVDVDRDISRKRVSFQSGVKEVDSQTVQSVHRLFGNRSTGKRTSRSL